MLPFSVQLDVLHWDLKMDTVVKKEKILSSTGPLTWNAYVSRILSGEVRNMKELWIGSVYFFASTRRKIASSNDETSNTVTLKLLIPVLVKWKCST